MGGIFQDFLTRKEDYLRALRGFLREIVRVVKNEFNFVAFCRSLMQERTEVEFTQLEQAHKVGIFFLIPPPLFYSHHFVYCHATGTNGPFTC